MSYKKGDLVVGAIDGDSRNGDYDANYVGASLPHSCDEWVVGGREEIKALIADLQEALRAPVLVESADKDKAKRLARKLL